MKKTVLSLLVFLCALCLNSPAGATLLVDGSFESGALDSGLPTTTGLWSATGSSSVVGATDPVFPIDGIKMLSLAAGSNVHQLIDIDDVVTDGVVASVSAYFNPGVEYTWFAIKISAYSGEISGFPSASPLVNGQSTSTAPLDGGTGWFSGPIGTSLLLPIGTEYLGIKLFTISGSGYVDNVTFVPEPATIALLGLGGLSLLRRKR